MHSTCCLDKWARQFAPIKYKSFSSRKVRWKIALENICESQCGQVVEKVSFQFTPFSEIYHCYFFCPTQLFPSLLMLHLYAFIKNACPAAAFEEDALCFLCPVASCKCKKKISRIFTINAHTYLHYVCLWRKSIINKNFKVKAQ